MLVRDLYKFTVTRYIKMDKTFWKLYIVFYILMTFLKVSYCKFCQRKVLQICRFVEAPGQILSSTASK